MADPQSRSGERYADGDILRFIEALHAPHDAVLDAAFHAPETEGLPAIQVGPSEGKLLGLWVRLTGARRVVEIGTLAGYSGLWLARALPAGGKLWSIEIDPRHAAVARANFERAGLGDRAEVLVGAAGDVLPRLATLGPFDLVFLDADKERYPDYARWAADNLRPGGLLVADNAYYFGQLMADTEGAGHMRRFHAEVAARFESVCVPTPDGMLVGVRR